jgi:hypothetical protein
MLYSEPCKTGHLQVDETSVKVVAPFNTLVWSIPRKDVTYIALKKGVMMADLTIYTAYNRFPANFMAKQKAEKFLEFFPNVPVGPEPQGGFVPPSQQTENASQSQPQGQWHPWTDQTGVSQADSLSPTSSASLPSSDQRQTPSPPSGQLSPYPQYPQAGQYLPGQPPTYPPGPGMMPPMPPRKKLSRRTWAIIGAIVLIFIIIAAVSNGTTSTNTTTTGGTSTQTALQATTRPTTQPTTHPTVAQTPTPIPTKAPTPTPTPSFITFGDGTYQVGKDIPPGTYRTRTGSPGCYYERLSGFSGSLSDILANNTTDNPAIVTISATDKGFSSQNCGTWTSDLSQITTSKTTFGDGMYIVGTDITPGTYKNTGVAGCYYARLSGFSNTTDDIIANNYTDSQAVVTIADTDKGFQSNGCGTWTLINS